MAKVFKAQDLREMDIKKLTSHILGLEKDLVTARKALSDGSLPNPRVIFRAKKDIARAKTILNEKVRQEEGENNGTA